MEGQCVLDIGLGRLYCSNHALTLSTGVVNEGEYPESYGARLENLKALKESSS